MILREIPLYENVLDIPPINLGLGSPMMTRSLSSRPVSVNILPDHVSTFKWVTGGGSFAYLIFLAVRQYIHVILIFGIDTQCSVGIEYPHWFANPSQRKKFPMMISSLLGSSVILFRFMEILKDVFHLNLPVRN